MMASLEISITEKSPALKRHQRMPDFMIIGAAKSGTTSLAARLSKHRQIFMGPKKEYDFFSHDEIFLQGPDFYSRIFKNAKNNQLCMDASTSYTRMPQYPDTAERIYRYCPDAKFIYMMRHPVDRAYSHYIHRFTKELYPGRPFDKTFEEHVETDPVCLDSSDYKLQLESFFKYFPVESFFFVFTHQYSVEEGMILSNLFEFIGIKSDTEVFSHRSLHKNRFKDFRETRVRKELTDKIKSNHKMANTAYLLPKRMRSSLYRLARKIGVGRKIEKGFTPPPMKRDTRLSLIERYKPGNEWLAKLTGTDLSCWNE
ncbi:MAG: sulfotransferase [Deltaproteobacteria bacterium]|nr:sulfotransferase [Deltaproteobacteria bacterium]